MTAPPILSVTETSLAEQFLAYDLATWPMQQALSRNLWLGWEEVKKRENITMHAFLSRVLGEMQRRGSTKGRTVQGFWPYLFTGCALEGGFTPASLTEGELIGKALDRLNLSPDVVRAHIEAGNLAEVVAGHRAPTTTVRVTAETKDVLDDAAQRARTTLNTEGLSDLEVRAILPKAWANSSEQVKDFLLRLGNGDIDPTRTYIVEAEEARPNAPVKPAAAPVDYVTFGKLNAPCYWCGRTPAESGFPHEAHHLPIGDHEARPNDGTPPVWAFICPRCHRPEPGGPLTVHSRLGAVRSDPEKLERVIYYTVRCLNLYQQAIGAARPKGERA
ncbi:hypothetical protein DEIPH_ctg011orf0048 [Deinococcus phoenicis]|uniref:Uncharacterized protein n=1 Tax=Deinococcus phoenicis TaxID=1476583 RepID=A0A016QSL7_9DEIO|nr:hypothetical protein [Deinococcus phoenicis]EYB69080.1 hypothetical protein DEIPH_ctg011orf0048 [Deinococcus phoenicis]